ncbi:MAG: hypothetical protein AAGI51_02940, partial [Pseudomonadota bacterium]
GAARGHAAGVDVHHGGRGALHHRGEGELDFGARCRRLRLLGQGRRGDNRHRARGERADASPSGHGSLVEPASRPYLVGTAGGPKGPGAADLTESALKEYDQMDRKKKREAWRDALQFVGILFGLPVLGILWATTFLI